MSARDIRQAALLATGKLQFRGWCKYRPENADHKICLGEALLTSLDDLGVISRSRLELAWDRDPVWKKAERYISQLVAELFPGRVSRDSYPWQFNDHPDTTLEDVMLLLKHLSEIPDD